MNLGFRQRELGAVRTAFDDRSNRDGNLSGAEDVPLAEEQVGDVEVALVDDETVGMADVPIGRVNARTPLEVDLAFGKRLALDESIAGTETTHPKTAKGAAHGTEAEHRCLNQGLVIETRGSRDRGFSLLHIGGEPRELLEGAQEMDRDIRRRHDLDWH